MSQSKGEAAKVVNAFYLTERMKLSGQQCSVVVKCCRQPISCVAAQSSEKFCNKQCSQSTSNEDLA